MPYYGFEKLADEVAGERSGFARATQAQSWIVTMMMIIVGTTSPPTATIFW
jgi:hypothetical protein